MMTLLPIATRTIIPFSNQAKATYVWGEVEIIFNDTGVFFWRYYHSSRLVASRSEAEYHMKIASAKRRRQNDVLESEAIRRTGSRLIEANISKRKANTRSVM